MQPWMTPREAAERYGISLADVWRWQAAGRLRLDRTRAAGAWLLDPRDSEDILPPGRLECVQACVQNLTQDSVLLHGSRPLASEND